MAGCLDCPGKVTAIVALEIPQGHANQRAQVLDVRQARCLANEVFLLAAHRVKFFDLLDGCSQILQFLGALARIATQGIQAMLDVDRVTESGAVLFERSRVFLTAELIERTALGGFPRQADLVGLPVDRHHRPDDIRQNRGRHGT